LQLRLHRVLRGGILRLTHRAGGLSQYRADRHRHPRGHCRLTERRGSPEEPTVGQRLFLLRRQHIAIEPAGICGTAECVEKAHSYLRPPRFGFATNVAIIRLAPAPGPLGGCSPAPATGPGPCVMVRLPSGTVLREAVFAIVSYSPTRS